MLSKENLYLLKPSAKKTEEIMTKILLLSFIFFTSVSFCQFREGKIIFNDNTSIIGYGEIENNKILFKVALEDQPSEWNYEMVKGIVYSSYGFSEKYVYVKLSKQTKPKLLEVIDEGTIHLYKYAAIERVSSGYFPNLGGFGYHSTDTHKFKQEYYVKKDNEEYPTNLNLNFKSTAIKYFSDCQIICEKINKRIFTKETIEEMVIYYNDYCYEVEVDENISH